MTKTIPNFSVIIPAYKRNKVVKEAILSVVNQSGVKEDEIEIIIPDDEDDKRTRGANKIFFESVYKKILYCVNVHEEGPGGNRQSGFDKARGKYVVFLDSDDKLMPDFLRKMEKEMTKIDSVAAICFSKPLFDKGFGLIEKLKLLSLAMLRDVSLITSYLLNNKTVYSSSFYLCQMSHAMFKGEAIRGQKFNYDYRRGGEDWDFFVQTLKKGTIAVIPKKLLFFRYSRGSSTDNPINRANKWKSYKLLRGRLERKFRSWPYYQLMGMYIRLFGN